MISLQYLNLGPRARVESLEHRSNSSLKSLLLEFKSDLNLFHRFKSCAISITHAKMKTNRKDLECSSVIELFSTFFFFYVDETSVIFMIV